MPLPSFWKMVPVQDKPILRLGFFPATILSFPSESVDSHNQIRMHMPTPQSRYPLRRNLSCCTQDCEQLFEVRWPDRACLGKPSIFFHFARTTHQLTEWFGHLSVAQTSLIWHDLRREPSTLLGR